MEEPSLSTRENFTTRILSARWAARTTARELALGTGHYLLNWRKKYVPANAFGITPQPQPTYCTACTAFMCRRRRLLKIALKKRGAALERLCKEHDDQSMHCKEGKKKGTTIAPTERDRSVGTQTDVEIDLVAPTVLCASLVGANCTLRFAGARQMATKHRDKTGTYSGMPLANSQPCRFHACDQPGLQLVVVLYVQRQRERL